MVEPNKREVILSIETAVQGGSLSILADGAEIDGWGGTLEISKAEDVLEQIDKLLARNNIAKKQIKFIVISKDAGSLTGQKIGAALAKGLAKSLKCDLIEISVMEALLLETEDNFEGDLLTAVMTGKHHIRWQVFNKNGSYFKRISEPQNSTNDEFFSIIKTEYYKSIVFSSGIKVSNSPVLLSLLNGQKVSFAVSKQSIANLTGLIAEKGASDNTKGFN